MEKKPKLQIGLSEETTKKFLHRQLIKLGDMLGDGDCDPWVAKEYARVLKALGIGPKRKKADPGPINEKMKERTAECPCPACGGEMKQTRSGSMIAQCFNCTKKYKLLKRCKRRT